MINRLSTTMMLTMLLQWISTIGYYYVDHIMLCVFRSPVVDVCCSLLFSHVCDVSFKDRGESLSSETLWYVT